MEKFFKGYRITSPYGWRVDPIRGGREFHAGIDLVKWDRAPIRTFTEGSILFAGKGVNGTGLGGYGNVVLLKDRDGCAHLYAHLSKIEAQQGNSVGKDQVIGYQGATGRAKGSHLHYEIRTKSSPQYGWTANTEKSTLEPAQYLRSYTNKQTIIKHEHAEKPKRKKSLILPASSSSWRVYPMDKQPVKGNEKGYLNPRKFGGLEYDIIGNPQKDVFTIQSAHFGMVNIYAGPGTGAKFK